MKTLRLFWSRLSSLWRRPAVKRDIDEELRFHIERRTTENIAAGLPPEEAAREARKRFGNAQSVREECREVCHASYGEAAMNDVRFGLRLLLKSPGFTTVAVLTLALGIGVNAAMFSIVEAVVLRPLPFPEADRLVELDGSNLKDPVLAEYGVSVPDFKDWRETSCGFAALGMQWWGQFWVADGERSPQVNGRYISADLFPTLGVRPFLGRGFLPEDERAGGVVVLGHELWQRQFGADTNLLGKTIVVNDQPQVVVGVMPPGFGTVLPGRQEIWEPLADSMDFMRQRENRLGGVIGRLKPGVSLRQAQAEMDVIGHKLTAQYPAENKDWGVKVISLHSKLVRRSRMAVALLVGAAVLILLIVCANLGNLFLSRAIARQKELAIRAALGAGRWRLIRQLLTESLVLSLIGGVAGLGAAVWSRGLFSILLGPHLPRFAVARIDGPVWCFGLVLAVVAGLVCGLIPAWRLSGMELDRTLKEGGRRGSADRVGGWLRSSFVVSEVALALLLLIGAGLALRTVYHLVNPRLDLDPSKVVIFEVPLPDTRYPAESSQRVQFFDQLIARTQELPGVEAAGTTWFTPFAGRASSPVVVEGHPQGPGDPPRWTGSGSVSSGFFKAMGLPILQGRGFTAEDRKGAPEVAVVNQTMARRYWPGENPIGKRFADGQGESHGDWITVVGVVRDLRPGGVEASTTPDYYKCSCQCPWFGSVVVRMKTNPAKLIPQVQGLARSLDKQVPVDDVVTLDHLLGEVAAQTRLIGELLSCLAALALTLAVVGIYGVIAYTVVQRTHEFGLRMALGARKRDIALLVLNWGGRLALGGAALGLGLAWALTRLMTSLLEGVSPTDPVTFGSVALLVVAVALLACWLPARRATKVDPMTALRYE